MLPSDLNKFKEYMDTSTTYDYEDIGRILNLLTDNKTRSEFYLAIAQLGHLTTRKPTVEVKEYITTEAKYVEEKILITSYYENHVQHYALGNCIQRLKSGSEVLVFSEEYQPPSSTGIKRGTKN